MKKLILILFLQSCVVDFSDKDCIVRETKNENMQFNKKYRYRVFCKIGVFDFESDSVYTLNDSLIISKIGKHD